MKFLLAIGILISFNSIAQQTKVELVKFLIADMKNGFKSTKGELFYIFREDTAYYSRMNLQDSIEGIIHVGHEDPFWVAYIAELSNYCTYEEAKKLTNNWKEVLRIAEPTYNERIIDGEKGIFSDTENYGFEFTQVRNKYAYCVSILYSGGPLFHNRYWVRLILGFHKE